MIGWHPRDEAAAAPLAGTRVLDLSELLPGPFLTQSLVELGADVIKVERPPHGDNVRRLSPALFDAVNRGKRSLVADLKDAAQREAVLALADAADVLVESYRPGVLARLGLAPDMLAARNPRLVVLSLSGYGQDGPRALWPGHDINYLATAGIVSLAAHDEGPSPSFGVPVADLGAAVYALAALNAALVQRARTGRGQHLDVSITDCMAHWMNPRLAVLRHAGAPDLAAQRRLVQQRPAYGVFRCGDGLLLTIAALEDHFWDALVRALPLEPYEGEHYRRYAARAAEAGAINATLQQLLLAHPRDAMLAKLAAADVPVAEAVTPDELSAQPQLAARGLFTDTARGALVRFPVRLDGMPPVPAEAPPFAPDAWPTP